MIDIIGVTDQDRVDCWFDECMNDPSVFPYLGAANSRHRIEIPEDDHDGLIFMNTENTGLFKWYFDRDAGCCKFAIFVLGRDPDRTTTAKALLCAAIDRLQYFPMMSHVASRVDATNVHGYNFSKRYLGDHWGVEPSTDIAPAYHHFKTTVSEIMARVDG